MSQKSELAAFLSKRNANVLDRRIQLQQELCILPRWQTVGQRARKPVPQMEFHSGACLLGMPNDLERYFMSHVHKWGP